MPSIDLVYNLRKSHGKDANESWFLITQASTDQFWKVQTVKDGNTLLQSTNTAVDGSEVVFKTQHSRSDL